MTPLEQIHQAMCNDNPALLRQALQQEPSLKTRINDPVGPFDSPLINSVRSRAMLDVLLEAGADLNARSRWWAGSFGLLDFASDDLAEYAIQKGAVVDVHAAARLGKMDRLRELIASEPALVRSRGGDGKTPLHWSRNVEVATFLLDHGAEIDAKDVDHESTAVQHLIQERPDVARFLIARGAQADLLAAAALGDLALARKKLDENPEAIRMRVNDEWFPRRNPRAGGTIYRWTLGYQLSPHEVAKKFGHEDVLKLLNERSPDDLRFVIACWTNDTNTAQKMLAADPQLIKKLTSSDLSTLAHAATHNNAAAVKTMLDLGWPTDVRGQHNGTPLHWAAWHGNVEMTKSLLARRAALEGSDNDFNCSPLAWAIHGSENGWHKASGDYVGTVEALLDAGAKIPIRTDGTEKVRQVLAARTN